MEIKKFKKIVKRELTEERFEHCRKVAEIAKYLSKKNEYLYPNKAYLAGLLHDITKERPLEFHLSLFQKNKFDDFKSIPKPAYHSFSAKFYLKSVYDFSDPEINSAIKSHTLGKPKMNLLEKILYVSDFLGSDYSMKQKEYDGWLKQTTLNLNYGLYLKSKKTIERLIGSKKDIHNHTIAVYRESISNLRESH